MPLSHGYHAPNSAFDQFKHGATRGAASLAWPETAFCAELFGNDIPSASMALAMCSLYTFHRTIRRRNGVLYQ
jgi:hypothetical protein